MCAERGGSTGSIKGGSHVGEMNRAVQASEKGRFKIRPSVASKSESKACFDRVVEEVRHQKMNE